MLEELFSISIAFSLAFCEVGWSNRDGQRGNVGGDYMEGRDVSWLGFAHLEELVMQPQVVVVNSLALTLGEFRKVRIGDFSRIPGLVACKELIFDGIPVVPVDASILQGIPPNHGPVAKDQINLGKFSSVIPVGDTSGGFNAIDEQSGCDCVLVLSAEEQWHLRRMAESVMPLEVSSYSLLLCGSSGHLLLLFFR